MNSQQNPRKHPRHKSAARNLNPTMLQFIDDLQLSPDEKEVQVDMASYMIHTLGFTEERAKKWIIADVRVEQLDLPKAS